LLSEAGCGRKHHKNLCRLNLSISDFEFLRVLGDGSMSTVFLAKLKRTVGDVEMLQAGAECALKVFDKFYIQRHKMTESVIRERRIMDKMDTPWSVQLKYTFQDAQKIYMALEAYELGDLFEQIQLRKPLPLSEARFYAAEMVLILQCLRERSVVFRDFKPENLLLSHTGHLVLTDFGCAKLLPSKGSTSDQADPPNSTSSTSASPKDATENSSSACAETEGTRKVTFVGTADYLSPEVLRNTGCSFAVDLWGFGCILYQLIAGAPPFRCYSIVPHVSFYDAGVFAITSMCSRAHTSANIV
jgi:3-phosphoinositide dependent protein kinase-1